MSVNIALRERLRHCSRCNMYDRRSPERPGWYLAARYVLLDHPTLEVFCGGCWIYLAKEVGISDIIKDDEWTRMRLMTDQELEPFLICRKVLES